LLIMTPRILLMRVDIPSRGINERGSIAADVCLTCATLLGRWEVENESRVALRNRKQVHSKAVRHRPSTIIMWGVEKGVRGKKMRGGTPVILDRSGLQRRKKSEELSWERAGGYQIFRGWFHKKDHKIPERCSRSMSTREGEGVMWGRAAL